MLLALRNFENCRFIVMLLVLRTRLLAAVIAPALLASCGGGGGNGSAVLVPPRIAAQPANQQVHPGGRAEFTVAIGGSPSEVRFQWFRDGVSVDGATEASLQLAGIRCEDAGSRFHVQVSNGAGVTTSQAAVLAVAPCPGIDPVAGALGGPGNRNDVGEWARFRALTDIALDSSGDLYTAEADSGTVRRIAAGRAVSTLASFSTWPQGIAVGRNDTLFAADWANHTIVRIAADGSAQLIAGSPGEWGYVDGPPAQARFFEPSDVAVDSAGNVLVADRYNNVIRKIEPTGEVSTLAGSGALGLADGKATDASFSHPRRLATDAGGNVYVLEQSNCIRRISRSGEVSSIQVGEACTSTFDPRIPASYLGAIAVDAAGNILVGRNRSIVRIAVDGTQATLLDRQDPDPGPIIAGLAAGAEGSVYFAAGTRVGRLAPDGTVSPVAGANEQQGAADGNAAMARFRAPAATAIDRAGNLYITDAGNSTLRRVSPDGSVVTIAGLAGQSGSADGQGVTARFRGPGGVAVDGGGGLYVADSGNHTVRRVSPQGDVTTLAGAPAQPGFADGPGSEARLFLPSGVAVDAKGVIYVAERGCDRFEMTIAGALCPPAGHTIRRIDPAGNVTTLAGAPGVPGTVDGIGAAARFYLPSALTIDARGHLYVIESGNAIRRITPEGEVSTISPATPTASAAGGVDSEPICPFDAYASSIVVDAATNIFYTSCNLIRRRSPDGAVTTVVGTPGVVGVRLGGLPGSLNRPRGLTLDGAGTLYGLDENSVLKIVLRE